jgi:RNA polymerase sigma-70 factor (ECF subfamily)
MKSVLVDDAKLITEALRGNAEAFGQLVQRHQHRLYNAAYRFLDSAEDAQDVVQEAFLSAYQALDSFKGGAQFFTWLYRIAMNHAIDLRRKRKAVLRFDGQVEEDSHPADPSPVARPEAALEQSEDVALLRAGLARLSPEHRMVLLLKDLDGMKYEDMAEVLAVPIGTIRSRLHRARLELRQVLEELGASSKMVL